MIMACEDFPIHFKYWLLYCMLHYVPTIVCLKHSCSYEGRCGLPTNFDSTYCYALGYGAGALLHSGKTGLISSVCVFVIILWFCCFFISARFIVDLLLFQTCLIMFTSNYRGLSS